MYPRLPTAQLGRGSQSCQLLQYIMVAVMICLWLVSHASLRAAERALPNVGSSMPINSAMIAMTTSNSIRVNADRFMAPRVYHGPDALPMTDP